MKQGNMTRLTVTGGGLRLRNVNGRKIKAPARPTKEVKGSRESGGLKYLW